MSFLRKLFGGGSKDSSAAPAHDQTTHEGYDIVSTPMPEGGQFRVCALVRKEIDSDVKEHKLIRADLCSTADEASEIAIRKARQMINERGEKLFT